jgi:hypothetical protein
MSPSALVQQIFLKMERKTDFIIIQEAEDCHLFFQFTCRDSS